MTVLYHPEASAELMEAARYYHKRQAGLGGRFLDEVDAGVSRIEEAPERWRLQDGGYRSHSIREFPYFIAYRITSTGIEVLAVYHHSREPGGWKRRLDY